MTWKNSPVTQVTKSALSKLHSVRLTPLSFPSPKSSLVSNVNLITEVLEKNVVLLDTATLSPSNAKMLVV